jgi:uncharacterized membrane protein SpoIIM required for sporulation
VKQALFEERHAGLWDAFTAWLDSRERLRRRREPAAADALADEDVPMLYRRLCQHLALARDRQYSPDLVDRLNQLALRGHHLLYGARGHRGAHALEFLLGGFPRLVRAELRLVSAAALVFLGSLAVLFLAAQLYPDLIYYLVGPREVAQMEQMYDPANTRLGMRDADDNVAMFAFYIWNNVKIGFQTFAGGLAFGLGTLYFLLANGVLIGATAGHLTWLGYGVPFWSFVSGHSAMELSAIVISGAAGLRLGAAVIAPGMRSRKVALTAAARIAVGLMYGAALMFTLAAFIEGFWSPLKDFAPPTKYAVGIALWLLLLAYLAFAGRGRAH